MLNEHRSISLQSEGVRVYDVGQHKKPTMLIIRTVVPSFLTYVAIGLSLGLLPIHLHQNLGYGPAMTGVGISVMYFATFLSRPLAGRIVDRRGARFAVGAGLLACGVSGFALVGVAIMEYFFRSPSAALFDLVVLARLALGFAESWVATGVVIWSIGLVGDGRMTECISWNGVACYGGIALGAPLGVVLSRDWRADNALLMVGALSVLLSSVAWSAVRSHLETRSLFSDAPPVRFRSILMSVLPAGATMALASLGFSVISTFVALYYFLHHWNGVTVALTTFTISFIVFRFIFRPFIDYYGGYRVGTAAMAIEAAGLLLLALSSNPWFATFSLALAGGGFSLVAPALGTEVVRRADARNRGATLGIFNLSFDVALGVGGPILGLLVEWRGYEAVFIAAAISVFAAAVLAAGLDYKSRR